MYPNITLRFSRITVYDKKLSAEYNIQRYNKWEILKKTLYTGNRSIESRKISFLIDNERYTGDRNFRFTSIELARNSGKWVNAGLFSLEVRTHSATE